MGGGSLLFPSHTLTNFTIQADQEISLGSGSTNFVNLTIENGGVLALYHTTLRAPGPSTLNVSDTLHIKAGGKIECVGNPWAINTAAGGTPTNLYGEGTMIVAGDVIIDSGGTISADKLGFRSGWEAGTRGGPGHGAYVGNYRGSGAGYGGTGTPYTYNSVTAQPGVAYGSVTQPTSLGSQGGGYGYHEGGGAIRLVVANSLTLTGTVTACAAPSGDRGGTGSGGSVWITAQTIGGSGQVLARGGKNEGEGPGAGGRIKIEYATNNPSAPFDFTNNVSACGGGSSTYKAGAGTIVIRNSAYQSYGELIIDNDNYDGTNTLIPATNFVGPSAIFTVDAVVLREKGKLEIPRGKALAINGDFINEDGTLTAHMDSSIMLTSTNNATIRGNSTFSNLTSTVDGKTIRFEAGSTNTVQGMLTLTGVRLRSTAEGSYWYLDLINPGGDQDVSGVDVMDSNADPGQEIIAGFSIRLSSDSGHNVNWAFLRGGTVILLR